MPKLFGHPERGIKGLRTKMPKRFGHSHLQTRVDVRARTALMKANRPPRAAPECGHPYVDFESDLLWPVIRKGISDLVKNQDRIEQTKREYIAGYLCKAIRSEQRRANRRHPPGEEYLFVAESMLFQSHSYKPPPEYALAPDAAGTKGGGQASNSSDCQPK